MFKVCSFCRTFLIYLLNGEVRPHYYVPGRGTVTERGFVSALKRLKVCSSKNCKGLSAILSDVCRTFTRKCLQKLIRFS